MKDNLQPFTQLTRRGQLRRLRSLVETVLDAYDLGETSISLVQYWLNATFEVVARPHESRSGRAEPAAYRYALRIHRPDLQNAALIRSELTWLAAIRRDTNLVVPEPVAARNGEAIISVSVPGVPEPRHCVLFRWLPGRIFRRGLTPDMLEKVGEFMATLHVQVQRFKPPAGFTRIRWDLRGILSEAIGTDLSKSLAHLSPEGRKVVDRTATLVGRTMEQLGEGPDLFGLIHADLHRGNVLFHRSHVGAIDFDTSGWGYFPYDIGVTFSVLRDYPNLPDLQAGFFRGYRRVRPLPADHEAVVDMLMAGRILGHTLWLAALSEQPAFGLGTLERVESQIEYLRRFLDRCKT